MCSDFDDNKTSIYVDGLADFEWAPHKNVLIHTSHPEGANAYPRVTFQEMPSRRLLSVFTAKDSVEMTIVQHPQGSYLAVINKYLEKKKEKFVVELFETKDMIAN